MNTHACVCYVGPNTLRLWQQQPRPGPPDAFLPNNTVPTLESCQGWREEESTANFSSLPLFSQGEHVMDEVWAFLLTRSKVKRSTWEYISETTELEKMISTEKQNHSGQINHDPYLGVTGLIDPCSGSCQHRLPRTFLSIRVNRRLTG